MTQNVTSRALASVVLAIGIALVLLLAGALAQPSLADEEDEGITIEREGDELNITVDESEVEAFETVVVHINDSEGSDSWSHNWTAETFDQKIDLFDPPNGSLPADLTDATVEVTLQNADGEQVKKATESPLSLYAINASEDPTVAFDGETLNVTVEDVVGIEGTVPADVTGDGTENVDLTYHESDGNLSMSLETIRSEISMAEPFDITTFPEHEEARTSIASDLDLTERVDDPVLQIDDGALVLEYDLLAVDGNYSVAVDADDERERVGVTEAGTLDLSSTAEAWWFSGTETLTVFEDGAELATTEITLAEEVLEWAREELVSDQDIRFNDGHLEHPLLFDGKTYGVVIETADGEMTLWADAEDGQLALAGAHDALLAADVSITVFTEDGNQVLADYQPSDGDLLRQVDFVLDGQQLNVSESSFSLVDVESLWVRHDGEITHLQSDAINASAETIDLSALETEVSMNDSLDIVVVSSESGEGQALRATLSESSVESGDEASMLSAGDQWFLTIWMSVAVLSLVLLGVTSKLRLPVVGQPSTYSIGMVGLTVLHGLVLSLVMTLLSLRSEWIEVGAGAVLAAGLVCAVFFLVREKPKDWLVMVLATLVGVLVPMGLFIAGELVNEAFVAPGLGAVYGVFAGASYVAWNIEQTAIETGSSATGTTAGYQSAGVASQQSVDVTVTLVDELTGDVLGEDTTVMAKRTGRRQRKQETVNVAGGRGTASLQPGTWSFVAEVNGAKANKTHRVDEHQSDVRIALAGTEMAVQVQGPDGEPLSGATVTVEAGNRTDQGSTNRQGRHTTTVPVSTRRVDVSAEHELYKPASETVNLARGGTTTLTLSPRVGRLRVKASLGREPVSGVSITATRRDQPTKTDSGTTDASGTVEFAGLLVGRYDLDVDLPVTSTAFNVAAESASVREGATERRDVAIEFEYALSRQQKQQIRDLRGELQDIARSSRRDDAIQGYYASVLHSVLDEIERIPQSGHAFLEYNQDPDAVVGALLDATADTVETMDEVLSSQRNVNLFSACSDLPTANVEWQGTVDISTLLQDANRDVGQQRADVNTRLERVDEQITAELRELAEVSPAREMWDGIRDGLRDQSGLDEIEVAASIFVALLVLDAIESVFEHRELKKRLEQTVY